MKDQRTVFFIPASMYDAELGYQVGIVKENEAGYYLTDWFWGKSFKDAEAIAHARNARAGISEIEAMEIIGSSMRLGAVRR